jgi:hypothetical protein
MDAGLIAQIIIAALLILIIGYVVSVVLNKRAIDTIQTVATASLQGVQAAGSATLQATQYLISQAIYYGAYERSEAMRLIGHIITADQARDTALAFQHQPPYTVTYYPPQPRQQPQT